MSPVLNNIITAAQSLSINCEVFGGTGVYSYQWSSNCTGSCFITGQVSAEVMTNAARSSDSGVHSCTVSDDAGNSGSGSTVISVEGKYILIVCWSISSLKYCCR